MMYHDHAWLVTGMHVSGAVSYLYKYSQCVCLAAYSIMPILFKKKDIPATCTDAAHTYTHPYSYVSLYRQCYNRIKMRNGHSQHY